MEGRVWFRCAAAGFQEVLTGLDASPLDSPALGSWDTRALLGHACRAFLTIETYLDAPAATERAAKLGEPADYYRAAASTLANPVQVAQRGRDAGAALGPRPLEAAAVIAERVVELVARTADDALVHTPLGSMRLASYLPTRAFELTVHGIDLARAGNLRAPPGLLEALPPCLELCVAVASPQQRLLALLALTGREPLPDHFTIL